MRFGDWISREAISLGEVARRIGAPHATAVRRYTQGNHVPRPAVMRRIYLATAGAVTPNDFYDLPALPEASAASIDEAA